MTGAAPEFSRPVKLDQAISNAAGGTLTALPEERAALAARFALLALDRLEADYRLGEEAGVLVARGRLRVSVAQACVATGEPVPQRIDTPFAIRFLPESAEGTEEEEGMELSEEDCDTVFYNGGSLDLGEAVAETLALALEPFPRAPGADVFLRKMGVVSEEEQDSPFAALLRSKGLGKADH